MISTLHSLQYLLSKYVVYIVWNYSIYRYMICHPHTVYNACFSHAFTNISCTNQPDIIFSLPTCHQTCCACRAHETHAWYQYPDMHHTTTNTLKYANKTRSCHLPIKFDQMAVLDTELCLTMILVPSKVKSSIGRRRIQCTTLKLYENNLRW